MSETPKFPNFQNFCKFFSNIPIDLYGREAPPGKTRPPLSIRGQQKACFPQWVATVGFLFAAREPTLGQLNGLKGPTATPAPKPQRPNSKWDSEVASAAGRCGDSGGLIEAACQHGSISARDRAIRSNPARVYRLCWRVGTLEARNRNKATQATLDARMDQLSIEPELPSGRAEPHERLHNACT